MKTPIRFATLLTALVLATIVTTVQAQYTNPPTFTSGPSTQLSAINSGSTFLTLSTSPADITVTGQFAVNVPNTPVSGTLVRWIVDRPMLSGQLLLNFATTSLLDGFSQPPPGLIGVTGGTLRTFITDLSVPNSVIGNSMSTIPIWLNTGLTTWNMLSASSATFSLFTGTNYALRQVFDLDGVYLGGAGGTWVVDVPAMSSLAAVPEPGAITLLVLGLAGLMGWRRWQAMGAHGELPARI
jgi:hypothetical protein